MSNFPTRKKLQMSSLWEKQIKFLRGSLIESVGLTIGIKHKLHFTMHGGKLLQIEIELNSLSNCFICRAKSWKMNEWPKQTKNQLNREALKLDLSTKHARIRSTKYILHLSYNLPFKCWTV